MHLTPEQKGNVFGILSVGCDRETAAGFIGCSLADIARAMRGDAAFAASVRRTEAAAEVGHMRTVQEAAKDPKNWRASVWWLEQRSPERFTTRGGGPLTTKQISAFIRRLGECLFDEIHDAKDRDRVDARFHQIRLQTQELTNEFCDEAPEVDEPPLLGEDPSDTY